MQQKQDRAVWIDYLRGFITVLVVAHHSSLAYTTFASFSKVAYMLSTHPVVDTARSVVLDIFEDFNDVFFMSLMFLISGIFILPALARKGRKTFIRDRFYRLFIPFAIGVTFLMPFAYLPSWYLAHGNYDIHAFLVDYVKVEGWPAGPPWFIGVLFFFNLIVALIASRATPAPTSPLPGASTSPAGPIITAVRPWATRSGAWIATLASHPAKLFAFWYLLTLVLFLPLVLLFGGSAWFGFGPFAFQECRILLYFGYFVLGMLIGIAGTHKGLLAEGSAFFRKWPSWVLLCIAAYTGLKLIGPLISALQDHNRINEIQARLLYRPIWVLSCTASCMAFLALFRRLFSHASKAWDSLSANAYGIYLVHYIFVTWSQFLLLPAALPAVTKFVLTFLISLTLSWALTALVRKIPIVRKYL